MTTDRFSESRDRDLDPVDFDRRLEIAEAKADDKAELHRDLNAAIAHARVMDQMLAAIFPTLTTKTNEQNHANQTETHTPDTDTGRIPPAP